MLTEHIIPLRLGQAGATGLAIISHMTFHHLTAVAMQLHVWLTKHEIATSKSQHTWQCESRSDQPAAAIFGVRDYNVPMCYKSYLFGGSGCYTWVGECHKGMTANRMKSISIHGNK